MTAIHPALARPGQGPALPNFIGIAEKPEAAMAERSRATEDPRALASGAAAEAAVEDAASFRPRSGIRALVARLVAAWDRYMARRRLLELDDRLLKDIGLSRGCLEGDHHHHRLSRSHALERRLGAYYR